MSFPSCSCRATSITRISDFPVLPCANLRGGLRRGSADSRCLGFCRKTPRCSPDFCGSGGCSGLGADLSQKVPPHDGLI